MTFVFLHTADWQIGKAFGALPRDVAAALAEARLDAIDRLAGEAAAAGAGHVLVAGDVFDSPALPQRTLAQTLARLAAVGGVTWHLLPGNHDAHGAGSVWERLLAEPPPANVRLHLKPEPAEIAPGVWLLPAPLTGRATGSDPTAYFDSVATPAGALRIGLAHGSVRGFGSDGDAAVPLSAGRAAAARLDYLALGDWHGVKRIDPHTWYSGTPEPDRFAANAPGHALVVRIAGAGAAPDVATRPVARFAWLRAEIELRGADDLAHVAAMLAGERAKPSDVLLQLKLSGRLTAAARQEVTLALRRLEAQLRHLDCDVSRLSVRAAGGDLEALGSGGELRLVGARLAALAAAGTAPEAADALALLLDLAAGTGAAPA